MFVNEAQMDIILNGRGGGEVGEALQGARYDTGLMRPFFDAEGRNCVVVNSGKKDDKGQPIYKKALVGELISNGLVINGPTSLRKDEWIRLDQVVLKSARERLRAWSDLAAANTYGGFDGMASTVLEHETMNDPGEAMVDMDGLSEGRNDAPKFQLEGLPLPITHSDFHFSSRKLLISRNGGNPLDVTMAEAAGRRVAEKIEKTLIGVATGMTFGQASDYSNAPTVYGYLNHPDRLTKINLTAPTTTNGPTVVSEVLGMLDTLAAQNFYGPFMLYHSTDWDMYMDGDYIATGGNNPNTTLRNRLRQIDRIQDVRRLDFMTPALSHAFTLVLVQMTPDVARAVVGMDLTVVQWQSMGGLRLNFKVMAIQVPQLRSDYSGRSGIMHARTA